MGLAKNSLSHQHLCWLLKDSKQYYSHDSPKIYYSTGKRRYMISFLTVIKATTIIWMYIEVAFSHLVAQLNGNKLLISSFIEMAWMKS